MRVSLQGDSPCDSGTLGAVRALQALDRSCDSRSAVLQSLQEHEEINDEALRKVPFSDHKLRQACDESPVAVHKVAHLRPPPLRREGGREKPAEKGWAIAAQGGRPGE